MDRGKILPGGRMRSEKMPENRLTVAPTKRLAKKTEKGAGKGAVKRG